MTECKWLPPLVPCSNWAEFNNYENRIYNIFVKDFVQDNPLFENKPVVIRVHPKENGKEQTFYHITSSEYIPNEKRYPDAKRCERIRWPRAFIENYQCDPSKCISCSGIKYWEEPYGSNHRIYLLFEEEKYVVILERRMNYILLITAYYLDYPNTLNKLLKKYNRHRTNF